MKYFTEFGVDIHVKNDWGLRISVKNNHLETVKYLIEQGADLDKKYGEFGKDSDPTNLKSTRELIKEWDNELVNQILEE